jgi:LAO/AO transport system kinase
MSSWSIPVIKAVATKNEGVDELLEAISKHHKEAVNGKRSFLLAEKAYRLVQNARMKDISKITLKESIEDELKKKDFNLYRFVRAL